MRNELVGSPRRDVAHVTEHQRHVLPQTLAARAEPGNARSAGRNGLNGHQVALRVDRGAPQAVEAIRLAVAGLGRSAERADLLRPRARHFVDPDLAGLAIGDVQQPARAERERLHLAQVPDRRTELPAFRVEDAHSTVLVADPEAPLGIDGKGGRQLNGELPELPAGDLMEPADLPA